MKCTYCKEDHDDRPAINRLHNRSTVGKAVPDCVTYPCICDPHVGPYHDVDCPRREWWDLDLTRSFADEHY